MPHIDWNDVIRNREAYPDTMEFDLGNGNITTLGAYRRGIHELAQRTNVLVDEKRALEEKLAYALAHPLIDPAQQSGTRQAFDYSGDPVLNPLHQTAQEAQRLAAENAKRIDELIKMQGTLMQGIAQIPTIMRLEQLKSADPSLDPKALTEYAQGVLKNPDLAVFHRAMSFDKAVSQAREAGKAEGLEQAKKELAGQPAVPFAPYGPPQSVALPQPGHATMEEAELAAMQDPDVISLFYPQVT